MLVLTRKPGEALLIEPEDTATAETLAAELLAHGGLTVWIREIRGNSVRLGIEAPPTLKILRAELQRKPCPSPRRTAKA